MGPGTHNPPAVASHRGDVETIGERIRRLRLERGLSQRELSEPGISYAYISRLESNKRRPSLKAVRALAGKLGVTPEYLETGEPIAAAAQREWQVADAELEVRLGRDLDKAETALRQELAIGAPGSHLVARASAGLGLLAARRGDAVGAIPLLEAATRSLHVTPDTRPDVYEVLGEMYVAADRAERAVELFEACLRETAERAPDDAALTTRFAVCLAASHSAIGAVDNARRTLADATEAAHDLPVPQGRSRVYWMRGIQAWQEADSETALSYIRRAIGLLEAGEDTLRLARAHLVAGRMLTLDGRYPEATVHLDGAGRILALGGTPIDIGILRAEEAKVAAHDGDTDRALALAGEAAELLADDAGYASNVSHALAAAQAAAGKPKVAEGHYRDALEELARTKQWREAAQVARELAGLLRSLGRDAEAYELLDRASLLIIRHAGGARRRVRERVDLEDS